MKNTQVWEYNIIVSALIVILGAFELMGLYSVSNDPLLFGIGVIITGGILMGISAYGAYIDMMDNVQEILDNILEEMTIYTSKHQRRNDTMHKTP